MNCMAGAGTTQSFIGTATFAQKGTDEAIAAEKVEKQSNLQNLLDSKKFV